MTSVQHSQQFNQLSSGETPQRPLVTSMAHGGGNSSNAKTGTTQSGAPKRVTFDAPQPDSSDTDREHQHRRRLTSSGINEEEDEDSSNSYVATGPRRDMEDISDYEEVDD